MNDKMTTSSPDIRPTDANPNGWVDKVLPASWRPWARLMRLDRPVGVWLLLWPCWWSLMLFLPMRTVPSYVFKPDGQHYLVNIGTYMILFAIGAMLLRAAGCIINDLWDRDIDAKVARTAGRPIASGAISVRAAMVVLIILSVLGLVILSQFPLTTMILAFLSVPLIIIYPLAKRFTYWPQIVLGIVFNWGALLGWTALHGGWDTQQMEILGWTSWAGFVQIWPAAPAVLLYAGCIFWTLGYDTIYAHQDKADDVTAGVKSSALALGENTSRFLWVVYSAALLFWGIAGWLAFLSWPFYVGLALAGCHFIWQITRLDIDNPALCLRIFKSNIWFGGIMFVAITAGW